MKDETKVFALKRKDGKVFKIGDKFTYKNQGKFIVNDKPSKAKTKICGFEKHEKGWYVLFMPLYSNGKKEKVNPWRACDLKSAILIN